MPFLGAPRITARPEGLRGHGWMALQKGSLFTLAARHTGLQRARVPQRGPLVRTLSGPSSPSTRPVRLAPLAVFCLSVHPIVSVVLITHQLVGEWTVLRAQIHVTCEVLAAGFSGVGCRCLIPLLWNKSSSNCEQMLLARRCFLLLT